MRPINTAESIVPDTCVTEIEREGNELRVTFKTLRISTRKGVAGNGISVTRSRGSWNVSIDSKLFVESALFVYLHCVAIKTL